MDIGKVLALAATGRIRAHLHALGPARYVNFFSIPMMQEILTETGFAVCEISRAGKVNDRCRAKAGLATDPAGRACGEETPQPQPPVRPISRG
jgi:hypothetical protein